MEYCGILEPHVLFPPPLIIIIILEADNNVDNANRKNSLDEVCGKLNFKLDVGYLNISLHLKNSFKLA